RRSHHEWRDRVRRRADLLTRHARRAVTQLPSRDRNHRLTRAHPPMPIDTPVADSTLLLVATRQRHQPDGPKPAGFAREPAARVRNRFAGSAQHCTIPALVLLHLVAVHKAKDAYKPTPLLRHR